MKVTYQAFTGKTFNSEQECKEYESSFECFYDYVTAYERKGISIDFFKRDILSHYQIITVPDNEQLK